MAASQAANVAETAIGHSDNATITTDVSNYAKEEYGEETGAKIKAATWQGKNSVKLVEVPKPRVIDDGDVILKVTGSSICGSDLHLYHGSIIQLQKGDILGHEFCGIVDSVGPGAKNIKVGDRVVAAFPISCGQCMFCTKGMTSSCENTNENSIINALYGKRSAGIFGYSHFTGGFAGGQAEYVRVPYADNNLLPLPDDVPDEKGLYLSDVLATSWHCVVDTGVKEGDVVAIWGAGPIGQMVAEFCFLHGANRVIVIDGGDGGWRLDFIKSKIPKVETLDYTQLSRGESVRSKLKKMVCYGPDVALECAAGEYPKGWMHYFELMFGMEMDTSEILNEMITSVRPFGRVGITGVYVGYTNHLNIGAIMQTGIRLIGNGQAPVHRYWEKLLELVRRQEIDPLSMVTHRAKLEDIEKVYSIFNKRQHGIQKLFIETKFSSAPAAGTPGLTEL